jgi:hypothetical protein
MSSDDTPPPAVGVPEAAPIPSLSGGAQSPSVLSELTRIRAAMPEILTQSIEQVNSGSLPFLFWGAQWNPVQHVGQRGHAKWFFIGDIHGDFFALQTLLEEISRHPDSYVCFLGDLVDRGPHGIECFARLLEFAGNHGKAAGMDFPRVVWILGNHDEGVSINPSSEKKFRSSVEPAEFVDFLNREIHSDFEETELNNWGGLFIEVCERLPRALLFDSGLLATHGGVPLEDRWPHLKTLEAFNHKRCLGDFTWTRATKVPTKKGWKYDSLRRGYSSAFEFGYKDLEGFCKAVEPLFPVRFLVRGHDHVQGGFETPSEYRTPLLLTLNGFGFHYLSGSFNAYRPSLSLAVSEEGGFPHVVSIAFDRENFEEFLQNGSVHAAT